jgi:hypothetical protein
MEIAAKMKSLKRKHGKKGKHYGGNEPQPLYSRKHIANMMDMALLMEYGHKYEYNDELSVEFLQAGHILGAGSVVLYINTPDGVKTVGLPAIWAITKANWCPIRSPCRNLIISSPKAPTAAETIQFHPCGPRMRY